MSFLKRLVICQQTTLTSNSSALLKRWGRRMTFIHICPNSAPPSRDATLIKSRFGSWNVPVSRSSCNRPHMRVCSLSRPNASASNAWNERVRLYSCDGRDGSHFQPSAGVVCAPQVSIEWQNFPWRESGGSRELLMKSRSHQTQETSGHNETGKRWSDGRVCRWESAGAEADGTRLTEPQSAPSVSHTAPSVSRSLHYTLFTAIKI